jgi:methyl-accepting chemotaxis protein
MSSRKLGELATDIDDASDTVEELQHASAADAHEKLDELHKTLEDASDTIDDLVDADN